MLRKAFMTIILLFALAALAGGTGTAAAEQCSVETGQLLIDSGQYQTAVQEFTCVINLQPTGVDGYRGRIEAQLLLGQFSNAVQDYTRVTAVVEPVYPNAQSIILSGYNSRLAADPNNIPALTGKSFAQWWFFSYAHAIKTLDRLLVVQPDDVYGNLFRGSSRMLGGINKHKGVLDIEKAIVLAPQSADVRYIVADAYTYGQPDPARALAEGSLALAGGLNTPRVHAILAAAHNALGSPAVAAGHIQIHLDLVTAELVATSPIAPNSTLNVNLVPGRTYNIPVVVSAGESITIATSSKDFWDTILVLVAPDGTPVVGADDTNAYFAAIDWTAETSGTYHLQVTSFESVSTGELEVTRD